MIKTTINGYDLWIDMDRDVGYVMDDIAAHILRYPDTRAEADGDMDRIYDKAEELAVALKLEATK